MNLENFESLFRTKDDENDNTEEKIIKFTDGETCRISPEMEYGYLKPEDLNVLRIIIEKGNRIENSYEISSDKILGFLGIEETEENINLIYQSIIRLFGCGISIEAKRSFSSLKICTTISISEYDSINKLYDVSLSLWVLETLRNDESEQLK